METSHSQKRYDRIYNLIKAALVHFREEDLIEVFNDITEKDYEEKKEREDLLLDLVCEGYCIFKPEYSAQGDKLKEYAETNIFPYYNQQQSAILF